MASPTQWHHKLDGVWRSFRSWWWTGKPGVLQSMRLQRVKHDWVTEPNWNETSPSHQDVIRIIRWQNLVPLGSKAEKAMATHSSTLAWKIPWTEEPGRLQSMWSLRVGNDWATSLSLFTFMHWRKKWQPTPVFLPGESQRQRSLVGCRLWGRTESDTTEAT